MTQQNEKRWRQPDEYCLEKWMNVAARSHVLNVGTCAWSSSRDFCLFYFWNFRKRCAHNFFESAFAKSPDSRFPLNSQKHENLSRQFAPGTCRRLCFWKGRRAPWQCKFRTHMLLTVNILPRPYMLIIHILTFSSFWFEESCRTPSWARVLHEGLRRFSWHMRRWQRFQMLGRGLYSMARLQKWFWSSIVSRQLSNIQCWQRWILHCFG